MGCAGLAAAWWPGIFYIFGAAGLVWVAVWLRIAASCALHHHHCLVLLSFCSSSSSPGHHLLSAFRGGSSAHTAFYWQPP